MITQKILFNRVPWSASIEMCVIQPSPEGTWIGLPIVLKESKPGDHIRPTLSLSVEEAQAMMDELWNIGLRPSEGTGSAGALRATEHHLDDMRKIVFHLLCPPPKGTL